MTSYIQRKLALVSGRDALPRANSDFLLGDDNRITVTLNFAYTPGGNDELLFTGEFQQIVCR